MSDAVTPLQIVYRPLKSLLPYARNSRKHPPGQIATIKASLLEYGWTNSMLIADLEMIAGHGRLQAALELANEGQKIPRNPDPWSGPTVDLSHLTPHQRRAYVIMDNKSTLDGQWDTDMLAMELGELMDDGVDLSLAGFSPSEIDRMLGDLDPNLGDDLVPNTAKDFTAHKCPACGHEWAAAKK